MPLTYRLSAALPATILLASAAFVAPAQTNKPATLDIGDAAPPLKTSNWLKGKPVPALEKGHVYVVEFWATWCGPCRAAMPKISALSRKYRDQVTFIGLDAFESAELPKITAFVKAQGANMDYRVAADGPADRSGANWLHAAGEAGIPVAFAVDKSGRVAWIGHLPEELDKVLPSIVSGSHNLTAERARRAASRNPQDAVTIAMNDGDFRKAVSIIDDERAKHPETPSAYELDLYRSLSHFDVPQLRRRFLADLERTHDGFGIYNHVTVGLLLEQGLPVEAYRLGLEVVDAALKVSDQKLLFLARGAEIAIKGGEAAKAVELQTQALQVAEATPDCTAERLAELRKDLDRYKAAAGAKGA